MKKQGKIKVVPIKESEITNDIYIKPPPDWGQYKKRVVDPGELMQIPINIFQWFRSPHQRNKYWNKTQLISLCEKARDKGAHSGDILWDEWIEENI